MKIVLSFLLLTMVPIAAYAQAPRVDRIDVGSYGLYTAKNSGVRKSPDTVAGEVNNITNVQHAVTTRTVPAQLGVHFGFNYTVVGTPGGTKVPVRIVVIYPPAGLRNPATKKISYRDEDVQTPTIGEESSLLFSFEDPYEAISGVWTFEVWLESRKLAEQQFTIVKQ